MHTACRRRLMLLLLACLALPVGSCGTSGQRARTPHTQTRANAGVGAARAAAHPVRLFFYDWESNVLTPDGATVTSQLPALDPQALRISQAAGDPSQGQTLYAAVELAQRQRAAPNERNGSRLGSAYYLFARRHAYLAGPERSRAALLSAIHRTSLPAGSDVLAVPQGFAVVQAVPASAGDVPIGDASARFYVLRDRVALSSVDIKDPQQGFAENGEPDVEFRFTAGGKTAFHDVTRAIAQRGVALQLPGVDPRAVLQHFAVVLDGRLISVASIDPQQLPDGIDGKHGAVLEGGFTIQSARDLVRRLKPRP